jgi:hypothetical protein
MSIHDENLFLALGRLEGKVDSILTLQKAQEEQIKSHDERLRALESSRSFIMGGAAIVGAAASALVNFISKGH